VEKYSACESNAGGTKEGRMYRYEMDKIKLAEARRFVTDDFPQEYAGAGTN
jgi:hypothetical protein